jgi:hypothetical protein
MILIQIYGFWNILIILILYFFITNDGLGYLCEGCKPSGPLWIVFKVFGTIHNNGRIWLFKQGHSGDRQHKNHY